MNNINFIKNFEIKQKKRRRRKTILIFLIVFVFFFIFLLYYYFLVRDIVFEVSKAKLNKISTQSINLSISELLENKEINLTELLFVEKDNNNNIKALSVNTLLFNKISNFLATTVNSKIEENCKPGLLIPVGTLSGLYFLNGKGKEVLFSCSPVGNVKCDIDSSFESAGINQTIHRLLINVSVEISVTLPIKNIIIPNQISFLALETMIVGDIPSIFIN